jgi:hypothetical protein
MHFKFSSFLSFTLALALGTTMTSLTAYASEEKLAEDSPEQVLEQALADIEKQQRVIDDLGPRVGKASGIMQVALKSRLSKAKMSLLEQNLSFAQANSSSLWTDEFA